MVFACCRGSDNYYLFDVQEMYDVILKECGDFMKLRFVLVCVCMKLA